MFEYEIFMTNFERKRVQNKEHTNNSKRTHSDSWWAMSHYREWMSEKRDGKTMGTNWIHNKSQSEIDIGTMRSSHTQKKEKKTMK